MKVFEVTFESSNLRKVWYRTITMVALIKDKMQNTAIRIRLFFVSEVSMVCAVRTASLLYTWSTRFYTSLKKSIKDTRMMRMIIPTSKMVKLKIPIRTTCTAIHTLYNH